MKDAPESPKPNFRFITYKGQFLADRITEIEGLATEKLIKGIDQVSVLAGATVLLRMACENVQLSH